MGRQNPRSLRWPFFRVVIDRGCQAPLHDPGIDPDGQQRRERVLQVLGPDQSLREGVTEDAMRVLQVACPQAAVASIDDTPGAVLADLRP